MQPSFLQSEFGICKIKNMSPDYRQKNLRKTASISSSSHQFTSDRKPNTVKVIMDNVLSPGRRQAIIRTNAGILLIVDHWLL